MSDNPAQPSPADAAQRQMQAQKLAARMQCIGRKILVLSGKGGVGKSTVAVNMAMMLAQAGRKVGLLDVDLHGPSIPKILGLDGQRLGADVQGGIAPIQVGENLSVVSIGLLLESRTDAVIWRGPMKYNAIRQFLTDVQWGPLDYLVIDSPPGTGDEPLAVAQMVGDGAWAVVVTTPQDVAIADVRRSVSFCKTLNLHVAGILENMSGLVCPHCGEQIDLFKTGGGEALAGEVNVPFLGRIPLDPRIVASGDSGEPFVRAFADSPAAKAFASAMEPILNHTEQDKAPDSIRPPKENRKMRIAIPTAEGRLCMHFGHVQQFALVEVDADNKTITDIRFEAPDGNEPGALPRWLNEHEANVIIAGGMGQRAKGLLEQNGIEVIIGAPTEEPADLVNAYLAGTLEAGKNICDH